MAKFQSPLLGYNNNVRHRGRVFHIQTEDSGVNHPHVITHLFMDGGRILKSVKKSYAEHIGSDGFQETVRVLMKEQHKAMFVALKDGQFDEIVEPGGAAKKGSDPTIKQQVAPPANPPPRAPSSPEPVAAAAAAATDLAVEAPPPPTNPEPPVVEELGPNTIDESRRIAAAAPVAPTPEPFALDGNGPNTIPEVPEPAAAAAGNVTAGAEGTVRRPSAAELTLDFDALERDSSSINPMFQSNDLPPPPKNLFAKERGTGAYSTVEVEPHHDEVRSKSKMRPSIAPPRIPTKPPPSVRSGNENGRYAAARPASIFGSTLKPAAPSSSIFGDELVSDKSLDEVILSYLAEDLEPRK